MKVLIAARDIKDGILVTKPNGAKSYKVQRAIEIYVKTDNNTKREIKPDVNTVFLVPEDNGAIIQVSELTEMAVEITDHVAYSKIRYICNGEDDSGDDGDDR